VATLKGSQVPVDDITTLLKAQMAAKLTALATELTLTLPNIGTSSYYEEDMEKIPEENYPACEIFDEPSEPDFSIFGEIGVTYLALTIRLTIKEDHDKQTLTKRLRAYLRAVREINLEARQKTTNTDQWRILDWEIRPVPDRRLIGEVTINNEVIYYEP